MRKLTVNLWVGLAFLLAAIWTAGAQTAPEETIVNMLQQDRPYHAVSAALFDQLGWDLRMADRRSRSWRMRRQAALWIPENWKIFRQIVWVT